ncbi:beta-aspartyl-peptidase [Clostridium magnum]|uniref:Isoaspartyl dipeptidase n=1 Tax=Clostridium magnum DSM 2767 TaxID=1121326 RepID=A0A162R6M3_9CLOT|nr:beta-aspartyl-peptidase [Clostridium magnum]KZL89510.1 isoaspartyl dipeptidase [Clostridium magnum DSM 2767]SHH70928.1 beta-aspartyl-dipeptidase (metallo-type) [Clostridium magnum DSM 2767]
MLLIKNIEIFAPESLGKKDILLCFDKIVYISPKIDVPNKNFPEIEVIDGTGLTAVPGIIDLHVHITGGGGEGGFTTRVPELSLTNFTLNGITTCVGLLGTDGTTRSMGNLLAKARSLEEEGISTYCWTGCYEMPTRTITDSARNDIILVDKILGVGEIAISDHRGSHPSEADLIHLASESRVGGMISGKCGILHIHIGDGKKGLTPVLDIVNNSEIPVDNLLPTHINRNSIVYKQSIEYAKNGGFIDITTGIKNEGDDAVNAAEVYKAMLNDGISPYNITMSSDAGGSMPIFDKTGKLLKLTTGLPSTNMDVIKECILDKEISVEETLIPFTSSPARRLKLKNKGRISEGYDADLILMDEKLNVHMVICKGKIMVQNYKPIVYGSFEKQFV